ncbi:MAG TPA: CapA family protein [Gammaproteobacteria bacterium]|nr:CapA family protein [Gammaproteobacteria bacterium]
MPDSGRSNEIPGEAIRLFLCGDVMLGRGIDQILPQPSRPELFEPYVSDARDYVALAEAVSGPLPRAVDFDYVWGDALVELARRAPELRLINLETSITASEDYWPGKGINYRLHPANLPVLSAAGIDCCALANNHVLDWGYAGLRETLASLEAAGIAAVGAGEDDTAAERPAVFELAAGRRVLVFACGDESSGIPPDWAAGPAQPGVALLADLSVASAERLGQRIAAIKRPGDVVVVSIHWGSNWGYQVPASQRSFAHALIDRAGVDLVHGHSSHHPRPIEVYRGRLILYGCGDFLNDYEGIAGYEAFRGDLGLMYFAALAPTDGRLLALSMCPMQIRRFRAQRPSPKDITWLDGLLRRVSEPFGTATAAAPDHSLTLRWRESAA